MLRRLLAVLLVALLAAPLVLAQTRPGGDAPAFCDLNRDGRVGDIERRECFERCDTDKNGTIDDAERAACMERMQQARPGPAPTGDCRLALEQAQAQRERMRANITARWESLRAEQDNRTRAFGSSNHTEDEWLAFRAELAAQRARAEAAVRNFTEQLEQRIGRLEQCAGVAAAGRYAACDARPADYERFQRMVEREAQEFTEGVRARVQAGNATTPEERAELEARAEAAIAQHRSQMEDKWHALRAAHARSCLRENATARAVHEIQADVRADRLACILQAEAVLEPFLNTTGRDARNYTEAQRAEFRTLRQSAAEARAACEQEIHEEWKVDVRAKFNESRRRDRFGSFNVTKEGEGSGTATGRFVSFHWDESPFMLSEYTVQGVPLFETFSSPHLIQEPRFDGARLAIRGEDNATFALAIHDNPTGGFEGRCAAPGCSLTFPEGTTFTEETRENGTRYELAIGETRAFLFLRGEHTLTDVTVAFTGGWKLLAPAENFVLEGVGNEHRAAIDEAVAEGDVLAEINVVAEEETVLVEAVETAPLEAEGETPEVAVEASQEGDSVVVDVAADAATGESVVINVDEAALGAEEGETISADEIVVTYVEVANDGTETTVTIGEATDVEDALNSDEATPEVFVEAGEDGVQIVVSNPHFSAKEITISRETDDGTPATPATTGSDGSGGDAGTPGLGLAAVLAVVAVVAIGIRARRDE